VAARDGKGDAVGAIHHQQEQPTLSVLIPRGSPFRSPSPPPYTPLWWPALCGLGHDYAHHRAHAEERMPEGSSRRLYVVAQFNDWGGGVEAEREGLQGLAG